MSTKINKQINKKKISGDDYVGIKALAAFIGDSENCYINQLVLSSNNLHNTSFELIFQSITSNKSLTSIQVNGNSCAGSGAQSIANAIENNKTIKVLSLSDAFTHERDNNFEGINSIINSLQKNDNITNLNLSHNKIPPFVAEKISAMLITNYSLLELDLSSNKLGNDGVVSLTNGLLMNHNLSTLDLSSNQISDEGERELRKVAYNNFTLTTLRYKEKKPKASVTQRVRSLSRGPMSGRTSVSRASTKDDVLSVDDIIASNKYRGQAKSNVRSMQRMSLSSLFRQIGGETIIDFHDYQLTNNDMDIIIPQSMAKLALKPRSETMLDLSTIGANNTVPDQNLNQNNSAFSSESRNGPENGLLDWRAGISLYRQSLFFKNKLGPIAPIQLFCGWDSLVRLDLSQNKITTIPSEVSHLKNLRQFDARFNHLTSIPAELANCNRLESLFLQKNQITEDEIPLEILKLTKIKQFSMFGNNISRLTINVYDRCEHWTSKLDFSHCSMSSSDVPTVLFRLPYLTELSLAHNHITILPPCISELKSLLVLDLSHNQLNVLPWQLGYLNTLNKLFLNSNPLAKLPRTVRKSWKSSQKIPILFDYLKSLKENLDDCYRMKLAFVGSENVGKTTLLNHIHETATKTTQKSPSGLSTHGIEQREIVLRSHSIKIHFTAQDFAGQSVYYSTHQFFLTSRAIFLVVFNILDPKDKSIEYWLKVIQSRAGEAAIILVATHIDDPSCTKEHLEWASRHIDNNYISKYHKITDIFTVSCKTKRGLDDLYKCIIKTSLAQPFMPERVPRAVVLLEERILEEKIKRQPPVMSWDDFKRISEESGISTDELVVKTANFFKQIGMISFFSDPNNPSISDMVIIDPQWLANVFRSVIGTQTNFIKNGFLKSSDLCHIWKPPEFPTHLHPNLLSLLEKFELVYVIKRKGAAGVNSSEVSLISEEIDPTDFWIMIPSLLPEQCPNNLEHYGWKPSEFMKTVTQPLIRLSRGNSLEIPSFRPTTYLQRTHKFSYLPLGLFSRLIVRLIQITESPVYWKDGILVVYADNYALIQVSTAGQTLLGRDEIKISVYGTSPGMLLRLVQGNIDNLAVNWFNVESQVHVPCLHCCDSVDVEKRNRPYQFTIEECIMAITKGSKFVFCKWDYLNKLYKEKNREESEKDDREFLTISTGSSDGNGLNKSPKRTVPIFLSLLVPDIALAELQQYEIDYSQVKIDKFLSEGSSAIVLKGTFRGQPVAIKQYRFETAKEDEGGYSVERTLEIFREFSGEAWIMTLLCNHPNLVQLRGICRNPFSLVMDYIPDGSLFTRIYELKQKNELLEWSFILSCAMDIAKGMDFLHSSTPPVIHRDLKSSNVLLRGDTALVSDFGLSIAHTLVTKGRKVDNPFWLAVEVMKGEEYTVKGDVYSFGVILWELLTCEEPFSEYNTTFLHKLETKIIAGLRPTMPEWCPVKYKNLTIKCWNSSPDERPTFSDVIILIEEIITDLQNAPPPTETRNLYNSNNNNTSSNMKIVLETSPEILKDVKEEEKKVQEKKDEEKEVEEDKEIENKGEQEQKEKEKQEVEAIDEVKTDKDSEIQKLSEGEQKEIEGNKEQEIDNEKEIERQEEKTEREKEEKEKQEKEEKEKQEKEEKEKEEKEKQEKEEKEKEEKEKQEKEEKEKKIRKKRIRG